MIVDAVLIGRNEGARLVRSLASFQGQVRRMVYVDSGSSDDSVAAARAAGAEVVELDMSVPFTAARARQAGFNLLMAGDAPDVVQFVDGDCALVDGWITAGMAALDANPKLGMVTGWRSEIYPDASVYNAMCDIEWHRPAGPIDACGGDMLMRVTAFVDAGGYDATVIAAEDDELCVRLRKAGWQLERLPVAMTRHDADMHGFGQWWQRAVRTGHGFAQVGYLHPEYFVRERQRAWVYGAFLPLLAMLGAFVSPAVPVLILGVYLFSYVRTAQGLEHREGLSRQEAFKHAALLTLSKFPNLLGMLIFARRRLTRADMRIIEYK